MLRRRATPVLAALAALACLVAGCSSGDGADRGDDPTAGSPSTGTPHDPTATATPTPPQDPVRFDSRGRGCLEIGPAFGDRMLTWESALVRRPLTLGHLRPVGLGGVVGAFTVVGVSVVPVPHEGVPETGTLRRLRPTPRIARRVHWSEREPLAGAQVTPGRYYVFVQARVSGPAHYDGLALTWTDESGGEGSSTWQTHDSYRRRC
jgi:hypothetical protein